MLFDDFDDNEQYWDGGDEFPPEIDTRLNRETRELLGELGVLDFGEIIVDFGDIDPSQLRGDRFTTLQEVILFLHDIGILQFSNIVVTPENLLGYTVDENTPKRKRK